MSKTVVDFRSKTVGDIMSKDGVIISDVYPSGYTSLLIPDGNSMYGMAVCDALCISVPEVKQSILIAVRERESLDFIARMRLLSAMEGIDQDLVALFINLSDKATPLLHKLSGMRSKMLPFAVALLRQEIIMLPFKKMVLAIAPHVQSAREQRALLLFWYEIEIASRFSRGDTSLTSVKHMKRFECATDVLRSSFRFPELTLAERDCIRNELREQQRVHHAQQLSVEGVVTPLLSADKKAAINKVHQQQKKVRATKSQLPSVPGGPAVAPSVKVAAVAKDNTDKNSMLQPEYLEMISRYQDEDPRYGMFSNEDDRETLRATRSRELHAFNLRMNMMITAMKESGVLNSRPDATHPWISALAASKSLFSSSSFDLTMPFSVQVLYAMGRGEHTECLIGFGREIFEMSELTYGKDRSTYQDAIPMMWLEMDLACSMFIPGHVFSRKFFRLFAEQFDVNIIVVSRKNQKRNEKKRARKAATAATAAATAAEAESEEAEAEAAAAVAAAQAVANLDKPASQA